MILVVVTSKNTVPYDRIYFDNKLFKNIFSDRNVGTNVTCESTSGASFRLNWRG